MKNSKQRVKADIAQPTTAQKIISKLLKRNAPEYKKPLKQLDTDQFECDTGPEEALRIPTLNIQKKCAPKTLPTKDCKVSTSLPTQIKTKILVIDDSATIRKLLQKILESMGIEVRSAVDGYDALNILKQFKPNLIISDLMMPKMSGITLMNKIHREEQFMFIPVIIITQNLSLKCFEHLINSGASDVLGKPFKRDELHSVISKYITAPKRLVPQKYNNVGVISDSSYQRNALNRLLLHKGYQVSINSDFGSLNTQLQASSDNISAWVLGITEDDQLEILDELEQYSNVPMLMGVESPPKSNNILYPKWEQGIIQKLDAMLA